MPRQPSQLPSNLAWRVLLSAAVVVAAIQTGSAQFAPPVAAADGVMGFWSTDAGSALQVDRCGGGVCITVRTISRKAPGVVDGHNPDTALRTRPICRLNIGTGFKLTDPDHAVDDKIYDPETGKTYKSVMPSAGNQLNLRGYIGFKALGRSQTWHRTGAQYATCVGTTHR